MKLHERRNTGRPATGEPHPQAAASAGSPAGLRAPQPAAANPSPAGAHWAMLTARPGDHLSLMPGQLYFGGKAATVRTLLGSCVAITLWHPQRRLGGMCHFLLPSRPNARMDALEGRFGAEAVALMVQRLRMAGTQTHEYEAHLYGGADTQQGMAESRAAIGERNIEMGWQLIDHYGFALQAVDVGDNVPRTVHMDMADGAVSVRRGQPISHRRTP